jgi:hypothetical protein
MAFAHSSDTHVMRTSLAGQPTRSSATTLRASGTDGGVPGKYEPRDSGSFGAAPIWLDPKNP